MWSYAIPVFSLLSVVYGGIGPRTDLHIVNKVISPDGFSRSTVLAGKTAASASFPGPLITGNKGNNFEINVIDFLTDESMRRATSIHWHGLVQAGTPWADGPEGVTQCPIIPGQSFIYGFHVPDQAGTFWYHSHYSTQYCDGLRGVLVVYDPDDPHENLYDIDNDDTVITLADWYHFPAPKLVGIPRPSSTLINGIGRYVGGPPSSLSVISVIKGLRYRFRLVSMSCDPNYKFSIDGHTMTIIEVDGVNVQPLTIDSIRIFAGQRYSFILTADQPINNYWIRAEPNIPIGKTQSPFDGGINSAILRYTDAPIEDPNTTQTPNTKPLRETDLHPLTKPAAPGVPTPGDADVTLTLAVAHNVHTGKFTINGASFLPPSVPALLQIKSGAKTPQELYPPESVYTLPRNKVVEVSIPGGSLGSPHPFHLHGHTFSVIRSAGNSTYNFVNPVRRDVVSIGGSYQDNVTIRFTTDNPGPWIFHCHIDWHLDAGLAIVFAEDVPDITRFHPPPSWDILCPAFNVSNPDKNLN